MPNNELSTTYDARKTENDIYKFWEDNNCFRADASSDKPAYSIVIPPPNVTGVLHMGHALDETLQDIDFGPEAVISFACPVDIYVYCQNKLVGRVVNGKVDRSVGSINILVADDVKYLSLNNNSVYDIRITSYGTGTMSVTAQSLVDRDLCCIGVEDRHVLCCQEVIIG